MKITRSQLKQIIGEELEEILPEELEDPVPLDPPPAPYRPRSNPRAHRRSETALRAATASDPAFADVPSPPQKRYRKRLGSAVYENKMRITKAQLKQIIKEELNEIFGFGKKKGPRWADNPVCQTYEEELAVLETLYKATRDPAAKKVALAAYRALKHEFERKCLGIR